MGARVVANVVALTALAVLIGLGTWQVQRLHWKNDLTATINARLVDAPRSLDDLMKLRNSGEDVRYTPVRVSGIFDHANTVRVYELGSGKAGWHLYTPLNLGRARFVFVNRGFVPDSLGGATVSVSEPQGEVEVVGLTRIPPSETSIFTPANEPEKRRFYWRDFSNMVTSIHDKTRVSFAPVFIDQSASSGTASSQWPRAGTTRVNLSNRHLEYAITWYGLALALTGVYAFFMMGRRRRKHGDIGS